jgi:plastocyanin
MVERISYGTHQVKVGTQVTWTDTCAGPCSITFTTIPVDSGAMVHGGTFSHTFSEAGSFPFYCQFDPTEMKGTIIVTN